MKFACCIANKGCNDDLDILPMFPPPHKSQLTSMLSIFQGFAQIEGRRFKLTRKLFFFTGCMDWCRRKSHLLSYTPRCETIDCQKTLWIGKKSQPDGGFMPWIKASEMLVAPRPGRAQRDLALCEIQEFMLKFFFPPRRRSPKQRRRSTKQKLKSFCLADQLSCFRQKNLYQPCRLGQSQRQYSQTVMNFVFCKGEATPVWISAVRQDHWYYAIDHRWHNAHCSFYLDQATYYTVSAMQSLCDSA